MVKELLGHKSIATFQSRNRVSSNFNPISAICYGSQRFSFNLVIEYLLISTATVHTYLCLSRSFQSRNRVSSNFNDTGDETVRGDEVRFNLVIEYLLISTSTSDVITIEMHGGFNLVIEYLLISTMIVYTENRIVVCFNLVIEYLLISTSSSSSSLKPVKL